MMRSAIALIAFLMADLASVACSLAGSDGVAELAARAETLERAGKYGEAVPWAERALVAQGQRLDSDDPELAKALDRLARLYVRQERYAEAEPLYKRVLAIEEVTSVPDGVNVATTLTNLALLYDWQGNFFYAEPLFRRALAISLNAQGDAFYPAFALGGLAWALRERGRFDEAELLFKQLVAIREQEVGPDHGDVAYVLRNWAFSYLRQGRYAEGEALIKRAIAIGERALGPDHPGFGVFLHELALFFEAEGRFAEAEPLEKRALAILEASHGSKHTSVAAAEYGLGVLYQNQGRLPDAELFFKRSLAVREQTLGPNSADVALSLNNLAQVYALQGRYAEAEPLAERAVTIWENVLGRDTPRVAIVLTNLAGIYRNQGRIVDAEAVFKRALAIRQSGLAADNPLVGESRNNLAQFYYQQARYTDALPLIQATIAGGHPSASSAIPILWDAGAKGLMSSDRALEDAFRVVQLSSQTAAAAALSKLALRLTAGSDRLAQLIRHEQDLAAEAEALDVLILKAVAKAPSQRDAAGEQQMRDRMVAIASERDALHKVLASEFPDYAALSRPLPLVTKDVQNLLARDEALVAFVVVETESYVFAVTRDAAGWKQLPVGASDLAGKVAAFRAGLDPRMTLADRDLAAGGIERRLFDLGLAHELHDLLLGPVDALIKDKRHLLVVPAGALSALPFHLLVTEKPMMQAPAVTDKFIAADAAPYRKAAWLIKRQAVTVLPSVASLKALRESGRNEHASKPLIGFGDPAFGPKQSGHQRLAATRSIATPAYADLWQGASIDRALLPQALPPMPETADELRSIAAKVGASMTDIHLGTDASEATVKRAPLADYRIVYFATHGLVAGDVKGLGEPSLALTIPEQPSEFDDGLLTASEVAQLKLNADWVVLSACNTAAGDRPGAEALSGLARAFFYAGARALLVTHWPVASAASAQLTMTTFDVLKANPDLGRAEALRRAMLAFLTDPSVPPAYAYPAIWGAYSLVGEGRFR
jgi:CHAT domain-containing protein/Flp pilus assembly protein TadD